MNGLSMIGISSWNLFGSKGQPNCTRFAVSDESISYGQRGWLGWFSTPKTTSRQKAPLLSATLYNGVDFVTLAFGMIQASDGCSLDHSRERTRMPENDEDDIVAIALHLTTQRCPACIIDQGTVGIECLRVVIEGLIGRDLGRFSRSPFLFHFFPVQPKPPHPLTTLFSPDSSPALTL